MPRSNWVRLAEELVAELDALQHDQSIRLSLDEILVRAGGDKEPDGYRSRGYWASTQRGDQYWRGFRDPGMVINFVPDETGRDVEFVTFRLDRMPRGAADE